MYAICNALARRANPTIAFPFLLLSLSSHGSRLSTEIGPAFLVLESRGGNLDSWAFRTSTVTSTIHQKTKALTQQDKHDTIASEEHLADESVLVDTLATAFRLFGPHFLDVFQHHVAVAVKSLDAREQFAIIPAGDQDLSVCSGGGHEDGERAGG